MIKSVNADEKCAREADLSRRREAVLGIDALRERLRGAYGEMPDSVLLIREDRER